MFPKDDFTISQSKQRDQLQPYDLETSAINYDQDTVEVTHVVKD